MNWEAYKVMGDLLGGGQPALPKPGEGGDPVQFILPNS